MHEQITLVERGRVDFFVEGQKRTVRAGDVLRVPRQHPARRDDARRRSRADRHLLAAARGLPAEGRRRGNGHAALSMDAFKLDGQVALVTGASRGLGAAIACGLASAGADVALHSNEHPATATAEQIAGSNGRRTELLTADLADRAAADRLVADTLAAFGRIDILVNNAGIIRRHPAAQHTDEEWDVVIEVNLSNAFRLCSRGRQAPARSAAAREDHQRRVAAVVPGRHHRPRLRRGQGRARPTDQGAGQRMGVAWHQRQRDRARLHADRQHQGAARRPAAQPADHRAHSGRPLGHAR